MAKPKKKPVVRRRGGNAADIEIEEDTTPELADLLVDLEAAIGKGSANKKVTFTGRNIPLNQPTVAILAKRLKPHGYRLGIKVHPQDREFILPIVFEPIDDIEQEA